MYRQVAGNWEAIRTHPWQIAWIPLTLSVIVELLTFAVMGWLWRVVIDGFGHRLTFAEAFRIFYLSNLGCWVPGRIWQLFGILYLAGRQGIPPPQATALFVAIELFSVPASFVLTAVTVAFGPELLVEINRTIGPTVA